MSTNDYAKQLTTAKTTVTITPSPLILEKVGEKFRGLYIGVRAFDKLNQATGEIESKPVAHFFDGNKVLFNMGAQLTRAVETLAPGVSVEITLKELKPNKHSGKTKIYDIAPLDIERVDMTTLFGGMLVITAPDAEHLLPASKESGIVQDSVMTHAEADKLIMVKDL